MWKWIKRWYNGESVMESPSTVGMIVMTPLPYTRYHWTAKLVRTCVAFYLANWKWIWTTVVAIAAVLQIKGA